MSFLCVIVITGLKELITFSSECISLLIRPCRHLSPSESQISIRCFQCLERLLMALFRAQSNRNLPHNWTSGVFYERPNLLFLACRLSLDLLLNGEKMPAFCFCVLEENDSAVVNRGCLVFLNHKNTVCWTFASGQSFRISNIRYYC